MVISTPTLKGHLVFTVQATQAPSRTTLTEMSLSMEKGNIPHHLVKRADFPPKPFKRYL